MKTAKKLARERVEPEVVVEPVKPVGLAAKPAKPLTAKQQAAAKLAAERERERARKSRERDREFAKKKAAREREQARKQQQRDREQALKKEAREREREREEAKKQREQDRKKQEREQLAERKAERERLAAQKRDERTRAQSTRLEARQKKIAARIEARKRKAIERAAKRAAAKRAAAEAEALAEAARASEVQVEVIEPSPIEPEPAIEADVIEAEVIEAEVIESATELDEPTQALLLEIHDQLETFEAHRLRAKQLRSNLRGLDDPAAARAVIALFNRDGDPHNLRSHLLLALERMPEPAYFAAFLDALPRLSDEAPEWAFAAMMRLINTRGSADDSATRFEAAVDAAGDDVANLVIEILADGAAELPRELATLIDRTIQNLAS